MMLVKYFILDILGYRDGISCLYNLSFRNGLTFFVGRDLTSPVPAPNARDPLSKTIKSFIYPEPTIMNNNNTSPSRAIVMPYFHHFTSFI